MTVDNIIGIHRVTFQKIYNFCSTVIDKIFNRNTKIKLLPTQMYAYKNGLIIYDSTVTDNIIFSNPQLSQIDIDWKHSLSYPKPYAAIFKNIFIVTGTNFLINNKWQLLSDDIEFGFRMFGLQPKIWDLELSENAKITKMPPFPYTKTTISTGIHLTDEYESNYFHWTVEVLPKLYLYEKLTTEKNIPLIVSNNLHDNMYKLLDLVRSDKRMIIKLNPKMRFRVKKLVYLSSISRIANLYHRPLCKETSYIPVGLLKMMVPAILSKTPNDNTEGNRYIFIKRTSTYRNLLNQDEIENKLISIGFRSIDPGILTITDQINIFQKAKLIVAPTGAALTNILWCRPNTKIIVLHSNHHYTRIPFWDALSRVSESHLKYISGPRANNVTGYFKAHDDFYIDVNKLVNAVNDF